MSRPGAWRLCSIAIFLRVAAEQYLCLTCQGRAWTAMEHELFEPDEHLGGEYVSANSKLDPKCLTCRSGSRGGWQSADRQMVRRPIRIARVRISVHCDAAGGCGEGGAAVLLGGSRVRFGPGGAAGSSRSRWASWRGGCVGARRSRRWGLRRRRWVGVSRRRGLGRRRRRVVGRMRVRVVGLLEGRDPPWNGSWWARVVEATVFCVRPLLARSN